MSLEEKLKTKKFADPLQKVHMNVLYTAAAVKVFINNLLREYDLTYEQYNVLRILKGSHPAPMCVKDITARMIDKNSNTTRIIDKLERKKLAVRKPSSVDGREVKIMLKKDTFEMMDEIAIEIKGQAKLSRKFTRADAEALNQLLDRLRDTME